VSRFEWVKVRPMGAAPDSEPVLKELKHMHAIIETGGKQYKVAEGDVVFIEKLDNEAGDAVKFDRVLAILDEDKATFGAPVVAGACVEATIVKNGKGKKVRIFKYNAKKGYRKRQGHRQPYTKVEIGKISV
jgi:large subunit ribosomal protein L21